MSDATERLFAQTTMLDYLQSSPSSRPVKDILTHLQNNTAWGQHQLAHGAGDGGLRNVQNWLKAIRSSAEFDQRVKHSRNTSNRKQVIYQSTTTPANSLTIEQACLTLLAEKFLDAALPQDFYEAALHDSITQARDVLEKYEASVSPHKRAVKSYLNRVAIEQRGQQLIQKNPLYDVLGVISKAILDGRCLELSYNRRQRLLHPYAVVIREPKVYLLAVDDNSMKKIGPKEVKPVQFLCNRMTGTKVSKSPNLVPKDFKADNFIGKGKLNNPLQRQIGVSSRPFELSLRIYASSQDNLLHDLTEFPLSTDQKISKERGKDCHILTAPGMRASHQLVEWIMGRMERIEVLAPVKLRVYVAQRVADMGKIYANDG